DAGSTLFVANAGSRAGLYGELSLFVDGHYVYTLNHAAVQGLGAGDSVADVFSYGASDGLAGSGATLTVQIFGANDGPIAVNDVASVSEDGLLSASGNVLANDIDADAGSVLSVLNPGTYAGAYGILTLAADG